MAALRQCCRTSQACRACAYNRYCFSRWCRLNDNFRLVTCSRVNQTARAFPFEHVIKTRLVTTDTGVDELGLVLCGFVNEIRVSQERASHRNHVGLTGTDNAFCLFWCIDTVTSNHRNRDIRLHFLSNPRESATWYLCRDSRNARFVPTDTSIDNSNARFFKLLSQQHNIFKGAALLNQIQHRQSEDNDEILAHSFANRFHDL